MTEQEGVICGEIRVIDRAPQAGDMFAMTKALADVMAVEGERLREAAGWVAASMVEGGILHLFGAGHSALPAKDIFVRAGSLSNVRVVPMCEELDRLERVPGVAEALLRTYDMRMGEVMVVISNSGINPLPIEVALVAKARGLRTVGITSLAHSTRSQSRHPDGHRLFDVVDLVLDTHVPYGDAGLQVEGLSAPIAPLSTLAGLMLVHALILETIAALTQRDYDPPIRISRNTSMGDAHNAQFIELYGSRIPEL